MCSTGCGAEVLASLPDPPSYSAVRGMLSLLERHAIEEYRHAVKALADFLRKR